MTTAWMQILRVLIVAVTAVLSASSAAALTMAEKCNADKIKQAGNTSLIKDVQKGKVTSAADLIGAPQRGATFDDYGAGCPDNAAGCTDFYALSVPDVTPASFITWFQALAACTNAGKRLLANQEWTAAALGTPDPGTDNGTSDCNISTAGAVVNTGSRSLCASNRGAFDMVGNLSEWVAEWADRPNSFSTDWTSQTGIPGGDLSSFGGDGSTDGAKIPGALLRGGDFDNGSFAGVFAVDAFFFPSFAPATGGFGFRCAREP